MLYLSNIFLIFISLSCAFGNKKPIIYIKSNRSFVSSFDVLSVNKDLSEKKVPKSWFDGTLKPLIKMDGKVMFDAFNKVPEIYKAKLGYRKREVCFYNYRWFWKKRSNFIVDFFKRRDPTYSFRMIGFYTKNMDPIEFLLNLDSSSCEEVLCRSRNCSLLTSERLL